MFLKKISGNHFNIKGHCDLDLWPRDPNINRVHLLVMTNLHVKYKDFVINFVINGFQDNERKPSGLPTDRHRQTDWQTLAKQYTPSSSKGSIKITLYVLYELSVSSRIIKIMILFFVESNFHYCHIAIFGFQEVGSKEHLVTTFLWIK